MITPEKRSRMEAVVYSVMDALDNTKSNSIKYKAMFDGMSDAQFDKWMKDFLNNENDNFYLECEPFKNEPTMVEVQKAADILKVPLMERVIMPFLNPNGEPIVSKTEVLVGYAHMKRVQQMLSKKNSMSTTADTRNPKTGMLTGSDKNSVSSDVENISLVAIGADEILKEYLGPRSDDMYMKNEMLKRIARDGYVSIKDIASKKSNKVALNTLDTFFIAAGLKTNLVTDNLLLQRTMDNINQDVNSVSSKYSKDK